ncbi:MAG: hypothetical protein KF729_17530 [Sandaracinaceae bacterium]|nr:hypothetical protein [Sandaracinaceae bacterium]
MTWPRAAASDDPRLCRPQQTRLDIHGYVRAVSLDVRGVVPTVEEHRAVDGLDDLPDAMLDEWLRSQEFRERVVRRHRDLLWPNIEAVDQIFHFRRSFGQFGTGEDRIWALTNQQSRALFRGGNVTCRDEPATFDAEGRPITVEEADGSRREGWVRVTPFWAPGTSVRVCAFDAQAARLSPSGIDCATRAGINDAACGCGPGLAWCPPAAARTQILRSFNREVERRVAAHLEADEPYTALFTSPRAYVNGPLVHYWRHLTGIFSGVSMQPLAIDVERLPDVPFDQADRWEEIRLPDTHAGVLTSPVFLLRFQTNRARAARFHEAFLCEPFQPPPGGIPHEDEVAALNPDVQQRPGCNYCHAILEPTAAHWGRWTQQGAGFLEPTRFPTYRDECRECALGTTACSDLCRFNYVTRAISPEEEPFLGMLSSLQFLRREHQENVTAGPRQLVTRGIADGRLTACTARNAARWLLGRDPREGEEAWQAELTDTLIDSGLRYRELVRAIVRSETYRRAL